MTKRILWRRGMPKMPPNSRYVGRPSRYGNPFKVGDPHPEHGQPMTRADAVALFAEWIAQPEQADLRQRAGLELAGRNLACACPVDGGPCHADYWLEIANRG